MFYFSSPCLTQTFMGSEKNPNDQSPPSLPTPLCFTPPNGVRKSRWSQQLIQQIPTSIRGPILLAFSVSFVQIEQHSPYLVAFAIWTISSSPLNLCRVTTGLPRHCYASSELSLVSIKLQRGRGKGGTLSVPSRVNYIFLKKTRSGWEELSL